MLCAPTASAAVEIDQTPPPAAVPLPMPVPLSANSTEPVGVPVDDGFATTFAVNVTPWPKTVGGEGAADTVVVVVAPCTVCVMGSLRLVPNGVPAAAALIRC